MRTPSIFKRLLMSQGGHFRESNYRHEKTREHATTSHGNFSELQKLLTLINKFLRQKLTSKSPNSVKCLSNMIKLGLKINLFLLYLIYGSYFRLKIGNLSLSCNLETIIFAEIFGLKNSLAETFSLFSCLPGTRGGPGGRDRTLAVKGRKTPKILGETNFQPREIPRQKNSALSGQFFRWSDPWSNCMF